MSLGLVPVERSVLSGRIAWLGYVGILLYDGKGQFESAAHLEHPTCTSVALADLDDDGANDIVASRLGGMSGVWWNDGNVHFVPAEMAEMTETVLDGISVAAADLIMQIDPTNQRCGTVAIMTTSVMSEQPTKCYSAEAVRLPPLHDLSRFGRRLSR